MTPNSRAAAVSKQRSARNLSDQMLDKAYTSFRNRLDMGGQLNESERATFQSIIDEYARRTK